MHSALSIAAVPFRLSKITIAATLILVACDLASTAQAQVPIPQADPKDTGLEIPTEGAVRQGEGRNALVATRSGDEVVAKVHVDVGDRRLVILPDGRMASVPLEQAKPTDLPFKAATVDAMSGNLTATFQGFKSRKTARFLYVYNTSEGFYTATSRILETMFPGVLAYFDRQKMDVHAPEFPLVVIMFRTEEEFQKYQPMPQGVAAYYSQVTNHVVLYEQSDLVDLAPELAAKQSISTIAHEGVHQILFNIGVQQRMTRWPMWISEGLPEYFAPTSTGQRMRWKGVGTVNDMRMYELSEYLKRRTEGNGDLVRRAVEPAGFGSLEYAASWALVHMLATRHKEDFLAYLGEVSQMRPFADQALGRASDSTGGHAQLFAKHFGSDYVKLEAELLKHLKTLPYTDPIQSQTHYVVMFLIDRGAAVQRIVGVTASPKGVREFQEQTLSSLPPNERSRSKSQVRAFPNKDLAARFAEQWLNSK